MTQSLAQTVRTIDPQHAIHHFSKRRGGGAKGYLHLPLSNFFPSPIPAPGGRSAPTVEHYFAAAKTLDKAAQSKILTAKTPGAAKAIGRTVELRPDWEEIKLAVMRRALRAKFASSEWGLGRWLVETAPFELIEGNYWGDTFWGMVEVERGTEEWHGLNWLGVLLMARRAELLADDIDAQAPLFDQLLATSAHLVPELEPEVPVAVGRPCPNRGCNYPDGPCSLDVEFRAAVDAEEFYFVPEMDHCTSTDLDL